MTFASGKMLHCKITFQNKNMPAENVAEVVVGIVMAADRMTVGYVLPVRT